MKPSDLNPERWRKIDEVLERALGIPPGERAGLLDEACSGDPDLRAEVESLLEAHERAELDLDRPVSPGGGALVRGVRAAAEASPEGRRVGPFELRREIGRGGMGVVYLAVDTRLGRQVALKALPPWLGVGAEARRRFLAEARAVSALDHPNIATLYETDSTDDGQLYMVFAYYGGETLAARIRRGPLSADEAISVARGIASGLRAAHDNGIVHRDVKPSNVLITEGGEVKLLDFGVAKVAGEEATRSGLRMGTVAYMSPEQASGGSVDGRTDLWSLGVVLYEMVTGTRPFGGEDPSSLIHSILNDHPEPPTPKRPDLRSGLNRVIGALLHKDPDDRYATAGDVLEDLEALQTGGAPTAVPARSFRWRVWRSAGWRVPTAIAGLAVLVYGAWLVGERTGLSRNAGGVERLAVLPLDNLTGDSGRQYYVDGIHDVLISELGKLGLFDVISRTSVLRYRGTGKPLPEIAEELDVDAVVEGSVVDVADSLAVTLSLLEASPERRLWTASYRRDARSVYDVAREVSRSIAREMGVPDRPDSTRSDPARDVDPEAYDAYSLGMFHLEQRNREGFEQARRYLLQAIELDSTFAPAYTALAEAYGSATFFGMFRPSEVMPRVRALAERALSLDSTLSEAHRVSAAVRLYFDWDWERAEHEVRRALDLNPSNVDAYGVLSEVLSVTGRYDEALNAIEKGSELSRFVPFASFRPAVVLVYGREYDRAIAGLEEGLSFFPRFWQGHLILCQALAGKGDYESALTACEEAVRLSGRNPLAIGALGYVDAVSERRPEAEALITELQVRRALGYAGASRIAVVYGALGDLDAAFEWLEEAYDERDVSLVHLDHDPFCDPLREDPRFEDLRRRVGLPAL